MTEVTTQRKQELCTPPNTVAEAVADPHVKALELLQALPGTTALVAGLPLRFDGERPAFRLPAPELGSDNDVLF